MAAATGLDPQLAHVVAEWPHDRPLSRCRFAPGGRYVVCGAHDAQLQRYQLEDGARRPMVGGHDTWVQAIAFANNGEQVVSGACDGKITWWRASADMPVLHRSIDAHKGWVRCLVVSPDGKLLASCGNDNLIRIWNVAESSLVRVLAGHERHIYCIAFHPQGESLLSGDLMGVVKQWGVAGGKVVRELDATPLHCYVEEQRSDFGGVRSFAFSPNGEHVAVGGTHKAVNPMGGEHEPAVLQFDWQSGKMERMHVADGIRQGLICRLIWLSDDASLMGLSLGRNNGYLIFWKNDAEQDYFRFKLPQAASDMDLHPDGIRVALAHFDRRLRIVRLAAK